MLFHPLSSGVISPYFPNWFSRAMMEVRKYPPLQTPIFLKFRGSNSQLRRVTWLSYQGVFFPPADGTTLDLNPLISAC